MSRNLKDGCLGCGGLLGVFGGGLTAYICVFLIFGLIFAAPVEYVAEYWCSFFAEKPIDIPYWACILTAAFPHIALTGGCLGGGLTLLISFAIDNPWYIPN